MKIIHTLPTVSDEASGPSYSVPRLCESLIDQGLDVRLAVLDWSSMSSPPFFLRTFPLGFGPRRLGRSPAMKRWLFDETRQHSVDLIHNHSLWMMPNVYPGLAARKYNIPYIVSPRGTFTEYAFSSGSKIKRFFWPFVQSPTLKAVTCFHATATSEYQDIRRLGFCQPVAVIPNGIDIPPHKDAVRGNMRTLLFLGRIHREKGIDSLLYAWQVVARRFREWQLKIVGPDGGGYLPKMKALTKKLCLERVRFVDALYGENKFDAYRDAELFVLPSPSENFGMVVAEALSSGIPVIATKGAPWEGLETNRAGRWIEIGVDPLVGALEEMLSHSSVDLHEMGRRGRIWMKRDFSWQGVAKTLADTYRWTLNGGSKPDSVILY